MHARTFGSINFIRRKIENISKQFFYVSGLNILQSERAHSTSLLSNGSCHLRIQYVTILSMSNFKFVLLLILEENITKANQMDLDLFLLTK